MTVPVDTATSSIAERRTAAVARTLDAVREILAGATLDRAMLQAITACLEQLAAHDDLFPRADFPPPAVTQGVGASTRYRLNPQDGDGDIALYLNAINPGKTTIPHNHTTWAAIVAIEGQEENRIYHRTDDGSDPEVARLVLAREVTVRPGTPVAFMPEDIHSIHVVGDAPTLHFHLYGQPLETLSGRIGVDLESGRVVNYNATQLRPSKVVA